MIVIFVERVFCCWEGTMGTKALEQMCSLDDAIGFCGECDLNKEIILYFIFWYK